MRPLNCFLLKQKTKAFKGQHGKNTSKKSAYAKRIQKGIILSVFLLET